MTCERCGYEPWPRQRTWVLELNMAAQSQNGIGANGYGKSGFRYRAAKRAADRAVRAALARVRVPPAAGFRRVVVTRKYSRRSRPYDEGNFVGGAKPLIDTLCEQKVLVDDTVNYCKIWYMQEPHEDPVKNTVEVLIEEQLL